MKQGNAISVSGLHKTYGDFEAVRGIDFEVVTGEVFGLLGPNGAGKTTTVEILEGIRQRTSGDVRVLDFDPDKQKTRLKDRIGVCLQATNLPDKIKVLEALQLFGALYRRMLDPLELLRRLRLEEKRDAFYSTLSGGQKQRLAIALGLINDPSLLFLDEPTTGLDPQVRLEIHSLLSELRSEKRTILMTTHYIEEAERLCDRVAIVDAGKVIAIGTPRELQDRSAGKSTIEIVCGRTLRGLTMPEWQDATQTTISDDGVRLAVTSRKPARTLVDIVKWVDSQGVGLEDVHLSRPTLEDVFIELTGKEAARVNAYLALIRSDIRLAFRQRVVIFFNYLMPFAFFFIFAQTSHAEQGGAILQVVAMVTVLGMLGNGLFGAGIRAAQDRDANILRRYKVAPISPLPLLVASSVTGLVVYLPYVIIMLALARSRYGLVLPQHMMSVMIFIVLGVTAMRSIGLIVASVANSMQESSIIVQILYMAMLFLSGATFPTTMFPNWLMVATQFIPATWVMTGMQGMMLRNETLAANWQAAGALILTTATGLFLSVKLFRWEKEEKMRPAAKLWVLAVLLPFAALGTWQAYARDNISKTRIIGRDLARSRTVLIRNGRIFIGDGRVIENGAVLVKAGKIVEVYDGASPDPKALKAEPIEAAGKTILPGLIDMHVHLGGPGGFYEDWNDYDLPKAMQRNLAAYLYSGVTAVRSAGDPLDLVLKARALVNSGEKQGAEFFLIGPVFTTAGGKGTEVLDHLPAAVRGQVLPQFTRLPNSAAEAKQQVDALKSAGVDGIGAILEQGAANTRLDTKILNAISAGALADHLPMLVRTGDEWDVKDAIQAHVNDIERGSFRRLIPDEDFAAMVKQGIRYDPTLSVAEGAHDFEAGNMELLKRSLVQQVAPPALIAGTRKPSATGLKQSAMDPAMARGNLMRAYHAGVVLVAGSDAGNVLVLHGPTVQRELRLWVEAGIPVEAALRAATLNAAKALGAESRFGSIEKGKDATLLVVDGNPLQEIGALEAISVVMLKGERVDRAGLFKPE